MDTVTLVVAPVGLLGAAAVFSHYPHPGWKWILAGCSIWAMVAMGAGLLLAYGTTSDVVVRAGILGTALPTAVGSPVAGLWLGRILARRKRASSGTNFEAASGAPSALASYTLIRHTPVLALIVGGTAIVALAMFFRYSTELMPNGISIVTDRLTGTQQWCHLSDGCATMGQRLPGPARHDTAKIDCSSASLFRPCPNQGTAAKERTEVRPEPGLAAAEQQAFAQPATRMEQEQLVPQEQRSDLTDSQRPSKLAPLFMAANPWIQVPGHNRERDYLYALDKTMGAESKYNKDDPAYFEELLRRFNSVYPGLARSFLDPQAKSPASLSRPASANSARWTMVQDDASKFNVSYPADWTIKRDTPGVPVIIAALDRTASCSVSIAQMDSGTSRRDIDALLERPFDASRWHTLLDFPFQNFDVDESRILTSHGRKVQFAVIHGSPADKAGAEKLRIVGIIAFSPLQMWSVRCGIGAKTDVLADAAYERWRDTFLRVLGSAVFQEDAIPPRELRPDLPGSQSGPPPSACNGPGGNSYCTMLEWVRKRALTVTPSD